MSVPDAVAELAGRSQCHDQVVIDLLQLGFIYAVRDVITMELCYLPTETGMRMVQDNQDMLGRIFHENLPVDGIRELPFHGP